MPAVIFSMIAYECRRRNNRYQLYNLVALLGFGISERVTNYLYSIEICRLKSQKLKQLELLENETERKIKKTVSKKSINQPFSCVDNNYFQAWIHNPPDKGSTCMFHGSGGYIHSISKHLLDKIDSEHVSLTAFRITMEEVQKKPIHLSSYLPNGTEENKWSLTLKAGIYNTLIDYVLEKLSLEHFSLPGLYTFPRG